jgi:hypothetical protein
MVSFYNMIIMPIIRRTPDVRVVMRQAISQPSPGCRIELQPFTLAPPLARLLAPYSWLVCYVLEKVPFPCTHYVGVIQKG